MPKWIPLVAGALLLTVVGCGKSSDERGMRYMPDMADSPAKKSQEAYVIEAVTDDDGNVITPRREVPAMAPPVPGTVARDFVAYDIPATDAGLETAKQLVNPIAPTREVLVRGRERFDIYCATCHGKDGNPAHSSVTAPGRPAGVIGVVGITTDGVAAMPDGQIYHIITHGRGKMPNYAAQLLPEDRWAVIHYLRALHEAVNAKGEALRELELETRGLEGDYTPLPLPRADYERGHWPDHIRREGAE